MPSEVYCKGLKDGYLLLVEIGRVTADAKALIISLKKEEVERRISLFDILEKCCYLRGDCEHIFCKNGWDVDKNGRDCQAEVEEIFKTAREIIQEFDVLNSQIKLSCLAL